MSVNPFVSIRASPNSTVKEGDDVTLTCDVTKANPTVTSYVWSRTRDINNGVHTQATYTINQIQVEQNGTYTCYATAQSSRHGNLVGESSVTLTVQYRPTVTVTLKGNPVAVTEGDDVTFQCAAHGNPPVYTDYKWTHITFGSPESQEMSTGRELVLSRVTYLDNGEYVCSVRNSVGQGLGRKRLDVLYSPSIAVESRIVAASIGKPAILSISVSANPANASFTWKKSNGDKKLPVVGGIVLTGPSSLKSKLFIPSVQGSDYGQYVCTVSHTVASREFTFEIRPKGPPERPTDFRILSWTSVSVTLAWVSGFNGGSNQSFHIQYKETSRTRWQKDDQLVVSDPGYMKTSKAKVPDLNPATSYDFRLVSINKHPSTNSSGFTGAFTQKTKARPKVLDAKLSVSITPTVATVSWTISSGIEDITSYVVKYCERGTVVCNRQRVTNRTATSIVITLDDGFQDYTFSLLIYEEDDLVKVLDQPTSEPSQVQFQVGVIVGIVVAVLVLLILAVITTIVIRRFRKSKSGSEVANRETAAAGGITEMKNLNSQPQVRPPATESSIYEVPDHQANQTPIYTDLQPPSDTR
ncbi:roundabout homolog 1-like [Lingula anatina]|uniref:Roundabout homolog 1-like n=1 Tax=Lingula anatina TaxID=7574 RepID=A0A1S3I4B8_LINAN|nr:roundabout homolog 1-like [Lingula anatina]|eukprot:XP_013392681.1 roundabout homolog 1-like [Lingula anatina]